MMIIVENIPWNNSVWKCILDEKYRSVSIFFFFFRCNAKCVIGFHYFLVTQIADRSQTSTGLSVYVYGGLIKVLTLPATFFC